MHKIANKLDPEEHAVEKAMPFALKGETLQEAEELTTLKD